MSTPQRVAAGVPTGGQFAATGHGEATVTLPTLPVPPLREWHRDIIGRIKRTALDRDDTLLRDLVTDTAGVDALDRVDEGEYAPTAREQAEAHAAAVNNSGLAVQVHYLCDHLGTGEVDEAISRALAARYAEQAKPPELTPERIARNTRTLDDLAHIFRDPDLGVGVLEDAAEMLRDGGVHVATEDEVDDDAYEEIPERAQFTTQPGTPERDQEVLSALGWMYSKPEWDSDLIGWTSETLAHSGRDMTESEESTWGRH